MVTPEEDNELLVHIPFECPVQLTSFYVITGEGSKGFKKAYLHCNPPGEG